MKKDNISIILPAYNEDKCIKDSLNKLRQYLNNIDEYDFHIVVVNDGSKDKTDEVVKAIDDVHLVSYTPNKGKGGAVKEGLKYSLDVLKCDYMIFMDVDLSTDLKAIIKTINLLKEGHQFVIGSRYDKESQIIVKQSFRRRIISKLSRIIISCMFSFKIKDTQCGFKGMDKEVATMLIDKSQINDFSFDVEYLYIAKLNGYKFISIPVIWKDDRDSKVSPIKTSIRFFKDLFKIKRNKKQYLNKTK